PPLKAWLSGPYPQNQAELASPLTPADGARVLAVSRDGARAGPMRAQFRSAGETDLATIWQDRQHRLTLQWFVGQGFVGPKH
ncbi:MAG TPA: 4-amino-4-deoxy-L-arabinose transferase, partial [Caulobacteraceae bacterium]|nr:4-amino-4-deoxy-L-arabinose transferase [Caulobacteraceae bacterium]